jgi:hypothetical protein
MNHAPDVAKDRVIAVGDFAEPRNAQDFSGFGDRRHEAS